jgi:2-C-methyl-D-erythritol 2,4-cyclodiphosphate synthase
LRIGFGYDSHRLAEGRRLVLGGVKIPFEKGLLGHSDSDVLCHVIIDAILGALGAGDIGEHFPDSDPKWKDADSTELLRRVIAMAKTNGCSVMNIDSTVIAERPRLSPFIEQMKESLSKTGIPKEAINIKAKTNEGMGFIGRGEGIAAFAVCLLKR